MKVPADDVPQEYAGLLRVEGHSEETIAEYVKKYEAVVASYGEKYWPYNCKATYKGYLKYYISKRAGGDTSYCYVRGKTIF